MNTRQILRATIALFLSLLFLQCDSPLSDVKFDDTTVLPPVMTVGKLYGLDNVWKYIAEVTIYDKNGNMVELNGGSVTLQGIQLRVVKNAFGGPTYELPQGVSLVFHADSLYQFILKFSNGTTCGGTVQSQVTELVSLTVPSYLVTNQPMNISWATPDNRYALTLELYYTYVNGPMNGSGSESISIPSAGTGSYTVPLTFFSSHPGMTSLQVKLISEKNGTLSGSFRSGSSIVSSMAMEELLVLQ